jgi:hypothetical protein
VNEKAGSQIREPAFKQLKLFRSSAFNLQLVAGPGLRRCEARSKHAKW